MTVTVPSGLISDLAGQLATDMVPVVGAHTDVSAACHAIATAVANHMYQNFLTYLNDTVTLSGSATSPDPSDPTALPGISITVGAKT